MALPKWRAGCLNSYRTLQRNHSPAIWWGCFFTPKMQEIAERGADPLAVVAKYNQYHYNLANLIKITPLKFA